jgi:hypothetical protein
MGGSKQEVDLMPRRSRTRQSTERDPEFVPQSPGQIARKIEEDSKERPLDEKAKSVVSEADREFGGEYERRQEERAARTRIKRRAT